MVWYGMVWHGMVWCYAMLCYAKLCYAMLCYAMLCYAMVWFGRVGYGMVWYDVSAHAKLRYAIMMSLVDISFSVAKNMLYDCKPSLRRLCLRQVT